MTNECYILNLNSDDFPKVEIHREEKPGLIIVDTDTGRTIYGGSQEEQKKRRHKPGEEKRL